MIYDYVNLSSFSNREIDKNGFMHVKNCIVTKSEVNQYRGNEIPEWQSLGLDPNKIYDVLRPAEEIEKSLDQMRGIPILDDHDDVHDAEHPRQHMRIGSMGTAPEFKEPEVSAELTFWNKKEIDEINTKRRDNLSMGYDYTAVLENGEYNGKKYTVRMKDIIWNHVALVDKGRVEGAKVSDRALDVYSPELERKMKEVADLEKKMSSLKGVHRYSAKGNEIKRKLEAARSEVTRLFNASKSKDRDPFSQREDLAGRLVSTYRKLLTKDRDMAEKKKPMTPIGTKKKPGQGKAVRPAGKYEDLRAPNSGGKDGDAIFGREWEDIRRAQQGGKLDKPIAYSAKKGATEEDRKMLAKHGVNGLRKMQMFGILDRLGIPTKDSLPKAGSKTGDRTMATKRKRNGDAEPAVGGSGEEVEEIKENRVVAGIKALLSEFDNVHEEQGIDPGVTDEEANCLEKVRDFLDSFHNQGSEDEPGEEAGTSMDPMDEDPGMDEDPEEEKPEMGEDEDWPDNGASPKGTGDRKRKGMDAAMIEKRITAKFRAKDRALDECSDLIGSVQKARVLDSAMDVYAHALKTNGIEIPRNANLDGLRGMVMMLKKSRAGDSMPFIVNKPTGIDAQVQETISKSPYAPRY